MKFECSACGHLGEAEEVRPSGGGIEVVCAACGEANVLEMDGADDDEDAEEAVEEEAGVEDLPDSVRSGLQEKGYGPTNLKMPSDEALERLKPELGPGLRCPKCAKLLRADAENCVRCGLNQEEARRYADGEAPWETPLPGQEAAFEQADLLWSAFEEAPDDEKLANFVELVREEGLYELGIRRLRFHLVDRPEDQKALEALRELAVGIQSHITAARAKAEANADAMNRNIKQFKRRVIVGVLVVGTAIVAILVNIVW